MKKLILILFIFCFKATAQDINSLFDEFMAGYKVADATQMFAPAKKMIALVPDNYAGYALYGYTSLCKNDATTAISYFKTAQALAPFDFGMYTMLGYYDAFTGNWQGAQTNFDYAFQLKNVPDDTKATIDDLLLIQKMSGKDMAQAIEMVKKSGAKYPKAIDNSAAMVACFGKLYKGEPCTEEQAIKSYFKSVTPSNPLADIIITYNKAMGAYNNGKDKVAKDFFSTLLSYSVANTEALSYIKANSYYSLAIMDEGEKDSKGVLQNVNKGLGFLKAVRHPTLLSAYLLKSKMYAEKILGKTDESVATAHQLLEASIAVNSPQLQIQANNIIGTFILSQRGQTTGKKPFSILIKHIKKP